MTPMAQGCDKGELNVCKWLYNHGAGEDISRADNKGRTPIWWACMNGHLSVCEWLYKVGADEDISRANELSETPMLYACYYGNLSVCEWLVLNGALNRPTSSTAAAAAAAAADEGNGDQAGHIDEAIVERGTADRGRAPDQRPALLKWAQGVVAIHLNFLHVVLRGSVILPETHKQASPDDRCHLPRLPRDELERVGSFLGVETGRRLRNAREFGEALEAIIGNQEEVEEVEEEEYNDEEDDDEEEEDGE